MSRDSCYAASHEEHTSGRVPLRQARLRNEYAAWYPLIPVSIWMPAQSVARTVARQLLGNREGHCWILAPRWAVGPRILDDRHFLFRGGEYRTAAARTPPTELAVREPRPPVRRRA